MDVQDATICNKMGTVARRMLEKATTMPKQRRGRLLAGSKGPLDTCPAPFQRNSHPQKAY